MKPLIIGLWLAFIVHEAQPEVFYQGSTPCHPFVSGALKISTPCEFIKWKLYLKSSQTFTMAVTYGESQPNTNGFKRGGTQLEITGEYSFRGNTFRLQSNALAHELNFVKLDDNLYHFTDEHLNLLLGDSGYSFTLNRTPKVSSQSQSQTGTEITDGVFDGRTPCDELSAQLNLGTPDIECIKLKWRLKLVNTTRNAGTFELQTTNYRNVNALKGTWILTAGIIELTIPDRGTLMLQQASDQVLLFLNPQRQLRVGNYDFSYALNRISGK